MVFKTFYVPREEYMKKSILTLIFAVVAAGTAFGQAAWLDRPLSTNWNNGLGSIPSAPRSNASSPNSGMCRTTIRTPESVNDRALTRAGWFLYGPTYSYGAVSIVTAMASVDGMCRPNQYNGFVFVGTRFAGTLAPVVSEARSDGSIMRINLMNAEELSVEFARYTSNDAMCCPSQTSYVTYQITSGARAVVSAKEVDTRANCDTGGPIETQDNVVSGTVTYRQRAALPNSAVLTVRLVDISRQDISSVAIAEQRIDLNGKQVPISFDLAYPPKSIEDRNTYAVRAEISNNGRLLYTTDTVVPVITQGNPRNVELVLVPVGGGGTGQNRGNGIIRGTVTYLQRIALPANSEVRVRLVDTLDPNGLELGETTFSTGNRQVPIPFEIRYDNQNFNRQRNFELRAEIRTNDELRFRSEVGTPVNLRQAGVISNVVVTVIPATNEAEPITGRTLNLSKFGTGSMQIEGRGSELLVRAQVSVRADGTADVSVNRLMGSIVFTGRLVAFDATSLRIAVTGSGDADASGNIDVRYSGRTLNSISSADLVLDGQNVTLRF